MTLPLLGSLGVLALVDATSIGTLLIPVWLLLDPRGRPHVTVTYLAVLAGFYWLVGAALLTALRAGIPLSGHWLDPVLVTWGGLWLGAALLACGLILDCRGPTRASTQRVARWRQRALRPQSERGICGLALAAGALELASMLPFLSALATLNRSELPLGTGWLLLGLYGAIMIAPAGALAVARYLMRRPLLPALQRINTFTSRYAQSFTATALMTVGGLMTANAAIELGFIFT